MSNHVYTVFDIETTGLSAACQNEIIEFAGYQLDENLEIVGNLHVYIKPHNKVPAKITELTGITNDMLADKENRYRVLPRIRAFIGSSTSVCHNAQFDTNFISTMCVQQGLSVLGNYICTMRSYKNITGEKSAKLAEACKHFDIDLSNAHTADCDAMATVELFRKLMKTNRDGMYEKLTTKRETVVSVLKNIASQNPNKKVREALCSDPPGVSKKAFTKSSVKDVIAKFAVGKMPAEIASQDGFAHDKVALLFGLWLTPQRLPKFVYCEDWALNTQVKLMVSQCSTLNGLYELHKEVYKTNITNKGLYTYYWVKYRQGLDTDTETAAIRLLFDCEYPLREILYHFPQLGPVVLSAEFCAFAEEKKGERHSYIASSLCGKSELINAVENKSEPTSCEIRNDPAKIGLAVALELNRRNFFAALT